MFLIFDPVYLILATVGYMIMFLMAAFIAPKLAGRLAGRFSLYTSMLLVAVLILAVSGSVIYYVLVYSGIYIGFYGLIAFIVLANLAMYLISPYIINTMYGAKPSPELQALVDEIAMRLGDKRKYKAMIVKSPPNAFAYGNFLTGKFVAVSDALAGMLEREELMAVIGHEIGHHRHRDSAVMLLFGLLPSVIFYLGYALVHTGLRDDRNRGSALIGIAAVVASFVVQILVLAFSRLREYYADTEGVRVAGKLPMQASLAKIHAYYHRIPRALDEIRDSSFKALFIYAFTNAVASPYVSMRDIEMLKKTKVSPVEEFLSTHPPISKRLTFIDSLPY
ncbi:zinc metalloprotease HtpX [Geoglobus acetivorans]|uniref:Protease HtpX homolog n=1 Tax=Geoglobus acetivorans TaxID=565033 RepID=A0A0A7GCD3_GEOAI|nr:heat shock protein (htpX) [Geoglobus acetivorans]